MDKNKKILFTGIWIYLGLGCFAALLYCFFPSLSSNAKDKFENNTTIVVDTDMQAENIITDTPAATEETPAPTEETATPTPEPTAEPTPEPTPEPTVEATEEPTEAPVDDSIVGPIYQGTVNTGGLSLCMRDEPSLNAYVLTQIPNGSMVYALPTEEESWYQVITADGKNVGYSYKYISLTEISEDDLPDAVKEALKNSPEENTESEESENDDSETPKG
ncbi:MAG: SH3 domain-containing protein [Lachnospiraceae bacterium]|nr:SH3 domain-containing protein [Lachnospiraceae bacterium]